nr:YeeE/YedE family protein [Gammaproteobacteria bacterium]
MEGFTPVLSSIGGALIGLAAIALSYFNGRVAGLSGILGGVLRPKRHDTLWRAVFIAGLLVGSLLVFSFHPQSMAIRIGVSDPAVILSGLLVGLGTRVGNGCTSGHGVCGVGRLAPRSMVASAVFFSFAVLTIGCRGRIVWHRLGTGGFLPRARNDCAGDRADQGADLLRLSGGRDVCLWNPGGAYQDTLRARYGRRWLTIC